MMGIRFPICKVAPLRRSALPWYATYMGWSDRATACVALGAAASITILWYLLEEDKKRLNRRADRRAIFSSLKKVRPSSPTTRTPVAAACAPARCCSFVLILPAPPPVLVARSYDVLVERLDVAAFGLHRWAQYATDTPKNLAP